ncbi:hypothetical protein GCM10019059_40370 [Camelimonas fluminis]|nr:hypothetical protein GCM10019059_40370 [Camelimonas fluminis]
MPPSEEKLTQPPKKAAAPAINPKRHNQRGPCIVGVAASLTCWIETVPERNEARDLMTWDQRCG